MIKESTGYYYSIAALFGALGVGMLFGAYWSYQAENMLHVVFSASMSAFSVWFVVILCRRANALRIRNAPNHSPEPTKNAVH